MKKISIVVPCYNEEDNVRPLSEAILQICGADETLRKYAYELLFIDNHSTDKTRDVLTALCAEHKNIKAIFNLKNFGQFNSPYYGLMQADGDAAILVCADFQDPIEMLPVFVREWEAGSRVVCGIKKTSRENGLMYWLRSLYYKTIRKMSDVDQIEHFTGFGLYDRSFLDIMRELRDPTPFLRGIVAEYAPDRKEVPYEQQRRRAGKTHNNFFSLYDAAMLSFTSYTKVGLRIATMIGFVFSVIGFLIALVYLILKLCFWNMFAAGSAPILIGTFLFSSVLMFFIGLLGEYIMNINTRVINRPLVIEEKRLNFDDDDKPEEKE